jgi:hypothetical protein
LSSWENLDDHRPPFDGVCSQCSKSMLVYACLIIDIILELFAAENQINPATISQK